MAGDPDPRGSDIPPPEDRRRARLRSALGREGAVKAAEGVVGGLLFLLLVQTLLGFDVANPTFWGAFRHTLERGFLGTLYYAVIVIPISVATGFFAGWARVSSYRSLAWPVSVFVDIVRGIPPLVLALFAFLVVPELLPPEFNTQDAAILFAAFALAIHSGAYQAEIFRAGFQSVPRGQVEAAQSIGLGKGTIMTSVILPQTFRLSLPPLANEFATLLKDTSLLGALGAVELLALGQEFNQQAVLLGHLEWVFAVWAVVAALYFVLTFAVTRALLLVEKWFRVPGMEGVTA